MIYLITRHIGALEWLQQKVDEPFLHFSHLDSASNIVAADVVIGTLPINLIAEINARGARYFHIQMDLPAHLRGQELTAAQLTDLGACLVEYVAGAIK